MVSRTMVPAFVLFAGLLPISVQAQGTSKFTFGPSFAVRGVYDDNLFADAAQDRVGSYYLRFTPAFNTGYEGSGFSFGGGYAFDSDLYPDERSELTNAFARQRANLRLSQRMSRTASLSFNASYAASNYPSDLVEDTGLELGRRNSQRYRAGVGFSKQLSTQDSWSIGYNASLLEYSRNDSQSLSHGFTTSWSHAHSTLTSTQLSYSYRLYSYGDEITGLILDGRNGQSHLLTFGWSRRLGEGTTLNLRIGPRVTNQYVNINAAEELVLNTGNTVTADALASINYNRNKTSLSLAYARHESQVFSRSGFVNTDSVVFRLGQDAGGFHFGVSPGAYRNTRGNAETWTYRATADARRSLTDWLHLTASYRYTFQDGRFVNNTLNGSIVDGRQFDRNVVTFGLTMGHTFEE